MWPTILIPRAIEKTSHLGALSSSNSITSWDPQKKVPVFRGSIHPVVLKNLKRVSNLKNSPETKMVRTSPVPKKNMNFGVPQNHGLPNVTERWHLKGYPIPFFFTPNFCWELHWELDMDPRLQPRSHVRSRPRWCTHPRKRWCHLFGEYIPVTIQWDSDAIWWGPVIPVTWTKISIYIYT